MRNPTSVSPRVYFPIYSGRSDRHCPSQLILRHCSPRHILCSCPLPLCTVDRSRICDCSGLRPLIPPLYRLHPSLHLNKNPLWSNICGSKPHLLPTTLPWSGRNASTVLRLPRRIHSVKHSLFYRVPHFPRGCDYVFIYPLRSIRRQT